MTHRARALGARGESLAKQYLINQGYEIITSNWSTRYGEIDIVARSHGVIVFVEVKTRQDRDTESAFAGISRAKHARLVKAAYQYLHERGLDDARWRMDVIGVAWHGVRQPVIDHVEDAFDW